MVVCSKVPDLGFGEIHPTFLRRPLHTDLLSPDVLSPPPTFPLLFLVSSFECVSVYVFGGGCVWREILRAVGEVARKNLNAHLFCMGAAVGSGWQDLVGSHGACLFELSCGGWMVRLSVPIK